LPEDRLLLPDSVWVAREQVSWLA